MFRFTLWGMAFSMLMGVFPALAQAAEITLPESLDGCNLIFINIDALRADHLGCYGYKRNTSPFIDSLAKEGLLFKSARANTSFTRESVSVLFSGMLPSSSGAFGWFAQLPPEVTTLAERFSAKGYETIFLSNTVILPGLTEGFKTVQHLPLHWLDSSEGPKLSAIAFEYAKKVKDKPFFMYLHYFDPHGPYQPPDDLYLRFADTFFPDPLHIFHDVRIDLNQLRKEGFGPGDARYEDILIRYDAEIADSDRSVEMLFHALNAYDILEDTLVIISADHGEEFLEHDWVEHGWTLYEEVVHVPLIFWAPGKVPKGFVHEPVSIVDFYPTLAALFGLETDKSTLDGEAFFQADKEGMKFVPPKHPYIGELLLQEHGIVRCIILDEWKYLAARKWFTPRERPEEVRRLEEIQLGLQAGTIPMTDIWGPPVDEQLYNLEEDPRETHNVLSENPAVRDRLKALLAKHEARCKSRGTETPPRQEVPPLSPAELELLHSIGYF
ncbi:MAG: sulfatase [Candidatus Hydrogenedentota bacterium]